ncbi:MAG: DUF1467 family protein [Henriciella sp.]|nr:DUF1467 family protein [Henriciella sp.]
MDFTITGTAVIFVISWWLCFFVALPIGVRSQYEDDGHVIEGTEEGAPKQPMLKKKILWATIGAVVVTIIVMFAIVPWLSAG